MMCYGIICGFRAEQRIADRISRLTACGWQNPGAAQSLLQKGADVLVSFGLSGALDPALKTGDILIPDHVVLPTGEVHHCNAALVEKLRTCFPLALRGPLLASSDIIFTPGAKRQEQERTMAIAADMESAAVAATASIHGVPFCVFRVVADTAADTLPPAAQVGLRQDGTTAYGRVFRAILRDPGQIASLMRLGLASRSAMQVLRNSACDIRAAFADK
jgi:hypothetical protein